PRVTPLQEDPEPLSSPYVLPLAFVFAHNRSACLPIRPREDRRVMPWCCRQPKPGIDDRVDQERERTTTTRRCRNSERVVHERLAYEREDRPFAIEREGARAALNRRVRQRRTRRSRSEFEHNRATVR